MKRLVIAMALVIASSAVVSAAPFNNLGQRVRSRTSNVRSNVQQFVRGNAQTNSYQTWQYQQPASSWSTNSFSNDWSASSVAQPTAESYSSSPTSFTSSSDFASSESVSWPSDQLPTVWPSAEWDGGNQPPSFSAQTPSSWSTTATSVVAESTQAEAQPTTMSVADESSATADWSGTEQQAAPANWSSQQSTYYYQPATQNRWRQNTARRTVRNWQQRQPVRSTATRTISRIRQFRPFN